MLMGIAVATMTVEIILLKKINKTRIARVPPSRIFCRTREIAPRM